MADTSHAALVKAFEARYDFQSARNVLAAILKESGMGEKDAYSAGDVKKVVSCLTASGEGFSEVVTNALAAGDSPPAAPAKEAKAEAKADKKDAKKDDKKDDKKDAKKDAKT